MNCRGLRISIRQEQIRSQLIRAERTIKKALRCAIASPAYRLELLDIYAGILISQERWNEIPPFVEDALQLLPQTRPAVKLTANDPGVWCALQEEVVRKTKMVSLPDTGGDNFG